MVSLLNTSQNNYFLHYDMIILKGIGIYFWKALNKSVKWVSVPYSKVMSSSVEERNSSRSKENRRIYLWNKINTTIPISFTKKILPLMDLLTTILLLLNLSISNKYPIRCIKVIHMNNNNSRDNLQITQDLNQINLLLYIFSTKEVHLLATNVNKNRTLQSSIEMRVTTKHHPIVEILRL